MHRKRGRSLEPSMVLLMWLWDDMQVCCVILSGGVRRHECCVAAMYDVDDVSLMWEVC